LWKLHLNHAGTYGIMSKQGEEACKMVDTSECDPPMWFCGCFSSKALACMHEQLAHIPKDQVVLFWATKSLVQPMSMSNQDAWDCIASHPKCDKVFSFLNESGVSTASQLKHDAIKRIF